MEVFRRCRQAGNDFVCRAVRHLVSHLPAYITQRRRRWLCVNRLPPRPVVAVSRKAGGPIAVL
jgi:hypothetical protein